MSLSWAYDQTDFQQKTKSDPSAINFTRSIFFSDSNWLFSQLAKVIKTEGNEIISDYSTFLSGNLPPWINKQHFCRKTTLPFFQFGYKLELNKTSSIISTGDLYSQRDAIWRRNYFAGKLEGKKPRRTDVGITVNTLRGTYKHKEKFKQKISNLNVRFLLKFKCIIKKTLNGVNYEGDDDPME